eukprot:m51a1_g776 putative ase-activating protein (876) ;mRNA; f:594282-597416
MVAQQRMGGPLGSSSRPRPPLPMNPAPRSSEDRARPMPPTRPVPPGSAAPPVPFRTAPAPPQQSAQARDAEGERPAPEGSPRVKVPPPSVAPHPPSSSASLGSARAALHHAAPTPPHVESPQPREDAHTPPPAGDEPRRAPAARGSEPDSFLAILQKQDPNSADILLGMLKDISDLKRKIALIGKKNFQLETDIGLLDKKIALLIKNRISLEEVLADKGAIMDCKEKTVSLNKHDAEIYGRMFYLLQRQTKYISQLAGLVKIGEIDNFLQTVMFTLYGNQYEEEEEHLLLTMFRTVLKGDFAEAKSLNELLRANTALTRMMNTYTRRGPGQQYLKHVLTKLIAVLIEENQNLEINPGKVYEGYINEYESTQGKAFEGDRKLTPEQCAELPQIRQIIERRIAQLDSVTNRFVETICASIEHVPYGIRYICQQIMRLIKDRWAEATSVQICCAIGGFMILRFINPAIITPNAYMLTDAKLSAPMRRNLTLVAKVLQNLSNNAPFGGLKEFYMAPLNPVLKKYQPRLNEFLERLTEVEDLDNHLEMDQFLAMGKFQTEQSITISLNEIYFIHGLLKQHMEVILPDKSDELRTILGSMPDPPPALPRKDNANVELKLVNISRTDADLTKLQPEQLYGETKYLVFLLMRTIPRRMDPPLVSGDVHAMLGQLASHAATHGEQEMLDRISKILANLKKLVGCSLLSDDDNYARLRRDLYDDVTNVQERTKKIKSDTDRLRQVLQNMEERNNFGLQQLRAYEEYLVNVRSKTTPANSGDKKGSSTKAGPLKLTHAQLEKDGVITESQIPDERKGNIVFQISTLGAGAFEVSVSYRSRDIGSMRLQLDDLLERQANNELQLETDFVTLNVNLLIYLLNKHFVMS